MTMDVDAYCERIGYDGPRQPSLETLRGLHRSHLYTVPFENLDIALGIPIVLESDHLYDKIVVRRRGGFCYEVNGLFCELLLALGFTVSMLSGCVRRDDGGFGPEFDHMLLKVELPEPWLADVGFGESFVDPLPLKPGAQEAENGHLFGVTPENGGWELYRRDSDGADVPLYRFSDIARRLSEYIPMCEHHQKSPESSFTRRRICTMAQPDGRITLAGMRLIETKNEKRKEALLSGEAELRQCLLEQFGVELPAGTDWSKLTA
jgi:N-hydroxyarylamine O-acetyltransferase